MTSPAAAPARRAPLRQMIAALALILIGSAGAYAVKTDFGRVDVTGFTLPTQDGQWITADIFRPLAATSKAPVPLVVLCPGFERSKETLDSYAIELTRRGMAVITIDPYAQGASSASRQRRSATLEGYGVIPMIEYASSTPNLNYIDKARIGAAGYSAGGNAVLQSASFFGGGRRGKKASTKDSAAAGDSTTAKRSAEGGAAKPAKAHKATSAASADDSAAPVKKKKKKAKSVVAAAPDSAAADTTAVKPKKRKKDATAVSGDSSAAPKKKRKKTAAVGESASGSKVGNGKAGSAATPADSAAAPKAKAPSKLAAIFVGGYVLTLTDSVLGPVRSNVAMDYARYDEGAFRNEKKSADMRTSVEALRLVNSALPKDSAVSAVEIGKAYGDTATRTLRVVWNTANIHPLLPYDPRSIAHMVDYFAQVFGVKTDLVPSDQRWWIKELCTLMALVGGLLFLVPFGALLLRTPAFAMLAKPVPPALPKPGATGTALFWATFAVSALLACFLFIPMVTATGTVFPAATAAQQTWWFPQRINNAVLLWAVANGLIGLLVFWATYKFFGSKNGVTREMLGLQLTTAEFGRTLLLAVCVAGGFYALLFVAYGIFHTDFRFLFVSAPASFPRRMLLVALEYWPLFFVFYLANSIRVNAASRFAHQPEWRSMLVAGLANSVGLALILGIQYASYVTTGEVYWTAEWLFANLLFGIIPMMFLLPYFNRWFFRLTGRVYLGPMVTCLVFVMMMLTSNVCYIPLR